MNVNMARQDMRHINLLLQKKAPLGAFFIKSDFRLGNRLAIYQHQAALGLQKVYGLDLSKFFLGH